MKGLCFRFTTGVVACLSLASCGGEGDGGTVAILGPIASSSVEAEAPAARTTVAAEQLAAEFGYVANMMDFSFDAGGSSAGATFAWDFGDGTNATGVRVSHRYVAMADYDVTLTVTRGDAVARRTVKVSAPMARSGFENGTLDFASVCTTTAPNLATPATLADEGVSTGAMTGETAMKVKWFQTSYRGDRVTKGAEFCTPAVTRKEAWIGFMLHVPAVGYPTDKDAGVFQMFSDKGCSSWLGLMSVRNNDLRFEHRPACVAPTATVLKAGLQRNAWIPIVMHLVVSRQRAGQVRIWVGDDMVESAPTYAASGINVGFGNWVGDELAEDSWVYFKFGQYNYDPDNYRADETRTVFYDNVSVLPRGRSDAWQAVRPHGGGFAYSGAAFGAIPDGVYGRLGQHAFDGDAETRFQSRGTTGWLQYRFADREPVRILGYRLANPTGLTARTPREWRLLGSNDGRVWTEVDRRTMQGPFSAARDFTVTSPGAYAYYRMHVDTNNGDAAATHVGDLSLIR